MQRGRRELDVALLIVKASLLPVLVGRHAADLVQEVHVPGAPAELAVGDAFEADVFLHLHDVADRAVFDAASLVEGDATLRVIFLGFEERWGPEQAADVVGSIR